MTAQHSSETLAAEYYDGQTPVPRPGRVRIMRQMMYFEPAGSKPGESMPVPYSEIVDITRTGERMRITIKGAPSINATRLIVLPWLEAPIDDYASWRSEQGILSRLVVFVKHGSLKTKVLLSLLALPLAGGIVYGLLFESYRLVPRTVDMRIGKLVAGKITQEFKPYHDKKLYAVLDRIKKRLVPKNSRNIYTITVVQNPLPNAFALPSGDIIILSGLIALSKSPEEVAGVLAHEIEHVENRHGMRQLVRVMGLGYILHMVLGPGFDELEAAHNITELSGLLLILKYSRSFEREADEKAVRLLRGARIPPGGLADLLERMKGRQFVRGAPQWLDTHPDVESRIAYLRGEAKKKKFRTRPIMRKGESWARLKNNT